MSTNVSSETVSLSESHPNSPTAQQSKSTAEDVSVTTVNTTVSTPLPQKSSDMLEVSPESQIESKLDDGSAPTSAAAHQEEPKDSVKASSASPASPKGLNADAEAFNPRYFKKGQNKAPISLQQIVRDGDVPNTINVLIGGSKVAIEVGPSKGSRRSATGDSAPSAKRRGSAARTSESPLHAQQVPERHPQGRHGSVPNTAHLRMPSAEVPYGRTPYPYPPTHRNVFSGYSPEANPIPHSPNWAMPCPPVSVTVGNAAFQEQFNSPVSKFACVLTIGLPSSGKTTVGRRLTNELSQEGMLWKFFSGGDRCSNVRRLHWDTTKDVFDALSEQLDELQAAQATHPIRGLLIDKNIRGVEDVFYVSALLESKGLRLNGVVAFDASDDAVVMDRFTGSRTRDELREKIKYHRLMVAKIRKMVKSNLICHDIDSAHDIETVTAHLRIQVLGMSSLQRSKPLPMTCYLPDSAAVFVEDYALYARIINQVCSLAKTSTCFTKPHQFPGQVHYHHVTKKLLDQDKSLSSIFRRGVVVRRKVDGTKYILYHENEELFLIPRHMRAILRVPGEAWMGFKLQCCGPFLLDGELAAAGRNPRQEKFLVSDVIYMAEKGSVLNTCRLSSEERYEKLQSILCEESKVFFDVRCDMLIALQTRCPISQIKQLFEPTDYACEGLVFQSLASRDDAFLWRPPHAITFDFRLGAGVREEDGTVTYPLELFDAKENRYVTFSQFGHLRLVNPENYKSLVTEGILATCGLQTLENGEKNWDFFHVRNDGSVSSFKNTVVETLEDGDVSQTYLLWWLMKKKFLSAADLSAMQVPAPPDSFLCAASGNTASPARSVIKTPGRVVGAMTPLGNWGSPDMASSPPWRIVPSGMSPSRVDTSVYAALSLTPVVYTRATAATEPLGISDRTPLRVVTNENNAGQKKIKNESAQERRRRSGANRSVDDVNTSTAKKAQNTWTKIVKTAAPSPDADKKGNKKGGETRRARGDNKETKGRRGASRRNPTECSAH